MRCLTALHRLVPTGRLQCSGCGRSQGGWWRRCNDIRVEHAWYCGAECGARAVEQRIVALLHWPSSVHEQRRRLPLGLLLYSRGYVTQAGLQAALDAQHSGASLRIGEWLQNNGLIRERQLTSALAAQWACPVVSDSWSMDCARTVPRALLLASHMLPVRIGGRPPVLHVAFSRQIDRVTLAALEQMLGCSVEPCVLAESSLTRGLQALEALGKLEREAEFDVAMSSAEMTRIVSSYAAQIEAEECRIVNCGCHVWVRLNGHRGTWDICFRTPAV